MKLLVVDDSRNERKVIRFNFEWHGYQVVEAANGRQGLEVASLEKPDVIISDALMPIMDGFQFLHEIKGNEELKKIPFIFYSAVYTGTKEEELAHAMGARAFITKPISPEQLVEEVGRILASEAAVGGAAPPAPQREEVFLRNYCQIVATKLEEKVRELSEANQHILKLNRELEQRVIDRTAQLEAANRELEMFSYSVSHDLRAPLRHMEGFSQVLLEEYAGKLNTTGKDYLERIMKSSLRMWQMLDALLDLSRLTRGKLTKELVNLKALAQEIGSNLIQSQPERKVSFILASEVTGWGDPRLLRVVLEHLLDNAWKFSSVKREAVVEFFSYELEGKPVYVVRDNGVGFDMAYADKLFAPFQRLHRKDDFPGSGIGLATVRRIVNRHGGNIWAEAEPGKGASFFFTLQAKG